jgi:Helicase conserved C-terminal domain
MFKCITCRRGAKISYFLEEAMAKIAVFASLSSDKNSAQIPSGVTLATLPRILMVEDLYEDPHCRIFLSTDAGGLGLNLQAAGLVITLDLPWNSAVLAQRMGGGSPARAKGMHAGRQYRSSVHHRRAHARHPGDQRQLQLPVRID